MVMITKNMGKNKKKCKDKIITDEEDCVIEANMLKTNDENPLKKLKKKKDKQSTNIVSEEPTNVKNDIVLDEPKKQKKRRHQAENMEKLQELTGDSSSTSSKRKCLDISGVVIDEINTDVETKNNSKKKSRKRKSEEINTGVVSQIICEENKSNIKRKKEKSHDSQDVESSSKKLETETKLKKKKKMSKKVIEEESVEDKELDEFCNELDDEANEKYEDWIKKLENVLKK